MTSQEYENNIIEREPTGIPGLDSMLEGGIPYKSLIILGGRPGSGKTILASQFLYHGAMRGEPATYVSFAESEEQFLINMRKFGMDFQQLIKMGTFQFLDLTAITSEGMSDALALLTRQISLFKTKRLVVDSFSAIGQAFDKIIDARIAVHLFLGKLVREEGCTTLMLIEMPYGTDKIGLGVEEFVADGIILLDSIPQRRGPARSLTIKKMRGTRINIAPTTYEIASKTGITVFPRIETVFEKGVGTRRLKTGIPGMDDLIEGGILERSVTILVGAAGTGKSTFGLQFLYNGVKDFGDRGLLISFGEPSDQFRTIGTQSLRMKQIEKFEADDTLTIESLPPESSTVEGHLARFEKLLDKTGAKRIVIDDITGLQGIVSDDEFYYALKCLAQIAKSRDATLIFTFTSGELSGSSITGIGISTVMDNIIMLRYVELNGRMDRSMILLKMRGTSHDNAIRKFSIGEGGLRILSSYEGYSGILSGNVTPARERFEMKEKEIAEKEKIEKMARRRELEKAFEEKERKIDKERDAEREKRRLEFEEEERTE